MISRETLELLSGMVLEVGPAHDERLRDLVRKARSRWREL